MNKHNICIINLLILFIPKIFAQDVILSPNEVIKRAREGRAEFVMVVSDLQRFIPLIQDKKELYSYIGILDELSQIAKTLGIEPPNPLNGLASIVTAHATKWLRLDLDSHDEVRIFLRWANDNDRFVAGTNQISEIAATVAKERFLKWYEGTANALGILSGLRCAPYVRRQYEELQGFILRKLIVIMEDNELSAKEILRLIQQTKAPAAIEDIIGFLHQQILKTTEASRANLLLVWSIAIGTNVIELGDSAPSSLKGAPGQLVLDSIYKIFALKSRPDVLLIDEIMRILRPNQQIELGGRLCEFFLNAPILDNFVEFLFKLTKQLLIKYEQMGQITKDLEKLFARVAFAMEFERQNLEGTYLIDIRGKPATLTIANVGSSNFILCLSRKETSILTDAASIRLNYSFFHAAFNPRDNSYEAHHFAVDSIDYIPPIKRNWWAKWKFTVEENKPIKIEGVFLNGIEFERFHGHQQERYDVFPNVPEDAYVAITGVYSGTVNGTPVEVAFFQVGNRISALFRYRYVSEQVYLNFGYYNPARNVVYVTSGEFEAGHWVHVRGQFDEQGKVFNGYYLIGGRGIAMPLRLIRKP